MLLACIGMWSQIIIIKLFHNEVLCVYDYPCLTVNGSYILTRKLQGNHAYKEFFHQARILCDDRVNDPLLFPDRSFNFT
jgi:hypothetical protein